MSGLSANCPSCGAPITFKSGSSIVLICGYCHSSVARTDRELKDMGRVAELVETGSPLQLGLRGTWRSTPFELTGHAQLGHEAGGVWDEWYATFANGATGWLAEAQGRFYLTFREQIDATKIPQFDRLQLGVVAPNLPAPLVVAEKGQARALGASGEIPYRLVPGETFYYADLSGAGSTFGTIDYSEAPPFVFLGQEVTLGEIGLASARAPEREARTVGTAALSCPNCGGPLELRAPDRSERVTCPNCNGLLDVNQGKLSYLKSLDAPKFTPYIPIGGTGDFLDTKFTVLGFMVRSVEIEGTKYYWGEYLLYNTQVGFRWLVHSDDHWSFVQVVPPGEVAESNGATYHNRKFKIFQDAGTRVEFVSGEFYWKVEVGETTWATDYVRAPDMLSKEVTTSPKNQTKVETGEINWSLGTYVPYKEIQRKFGVSLPSPKGIAPNQPFPVKGIYSYWGILLLLITALAVISTVTSGTNQVLLRAFQFQPLANPQGTQVVFSDQFELQGRRNISVEATSGLNNSWIFVAGDFVNDDTGLVQEFELPMEYYSGVEDGESWSEGSQTKMVYLSALPAGKYTLRLEAQWGDSWQQPENITLKVDQGRSSGFNFIMSLIALSMIPVGVGLWQFGFERKRWSQSMFGGSSDSDDSDSDDD